MFKDIKEKNIASLGDPLVAQRRSSAQKLCHAPSIPCLTMNISPYSGPIGKISKQDSSPTIW